MTGKRNILDNVLALNSNEDLHDSEVIKNTVYVYEFNSYSFDLFANHIYLNDIELEFFVLRVYKSISAYYVLYMINCEQKKCLYLIQK